MAMAKSILCNTCYFIILTFCIDQGDGRWRELGIGNLRHDLELYKTMAEKIEREIEAFYDVYPEKRPGGDSVDTIHYKHVTNTFNRNSDINIVDKPDGGKQNFTHNIKNKTKTVEPIQVKRYLNKPTNDIDPGLLKQNLKWPKFEEILLEIGKKYDWKNDRWIKVKEKLKTPNDTYNGDKLRLNDDNKTKFHVLHKFNYKFVKLNRSKNRRSVIVAVTAVR